jgi:Glycosyl transferase family 2
MIRLASIVIKSYNYADYVGEAICSALSQTFPAVEVIVVENGSTDNSLEVIRSFGNRIRPIVLEKNIGPAGAEYVGFGHSTGDMIIFLDADDILQATAVESAAKHFTSDTTKVQFRLEVVNSNKSPLGFTYPQKMPKEDEIKHLLFHFGAYPLSPTSGNAYSRQFLEKILPCADPDLQFNEDLYTALLAPVYGTVKTSDEVLGFYRLHDRNDYGAFPSEQMSHRKMRTYVAAIAAGQRALEEHCAKLNLPIEPGLHWKWPYYCKLRLLLLKTAPRTHPFPDDRPWKLAYRGLVATFRFPELSFASRLRLVATFLVVPVFPSRFARLWLPFFDGSMRNRLTGFLRRMFSSGPPRTLSSKAASDG